MEPRLKTSRKWTALPKELLTQIRSVIQTTFKDHIGSAKVEADGRIYPEELLVSVGIKTSGTIRQKNWQVSIAYKKDKDNVLALLHVAMDAVGALFEQTFSAEDESEFPRIWEEIDFENRKIFIQFTGENTELESEANRILGAAGDQSLAEGDWDDEIDPEHIKASLGIDPEDDDDGEGDPTH